MSMGTQKRFTFLQVIGTGDGDTDLLTAPATGETLWVQHITVTIVTAAAQAFRIEDKGASPVIFFSAPASLAAGSYYVKLGPVGFPASTSAVTLEFDTAAAGVAAVISGWGYIRS